MREPRCRVVDRANGVTAGEAIVQIGLRRRKRDAVWLAGEVIALNRARAHHQRFIAGDEHAPELVGFGFSRGDVERIKVGAVAQRRGDKGRAIVDREDRGLLQERRR